MSARRYLSIADALAMYQVLMIRYGGAHGERDRNAPESALACPRQGYYRDTVAEGAALMESLAVNHPFVDGDKRVAFAITDVFRLLNGYRITASGPDVYQEMMRLFESRQFDFGHIEPWLRAITHPIDPDTQ